MDLQGAPGSRLWGRQDQNVMKTARNSIRVDITTGAGLTLGDAAAWRVLQAIEPRFDNPLFGPDFFSAVSRVRDDARVAIFRRGAEAVGFLPYHARSFGLARPIGAPFSDYQALVSKRDVGLSGRDALRLAGLSAFRFNGMVDPYGLFGAAIDAGTDCYAMQLDGDADAYLEEVRAGSPKRFKNYRRLEHRLGREIGPLRMVADDASDAVFNQIMTWKSEQFRRTGLQDVLRPEWTKSLMRDLFETREGPMRGLMMTLYAGDVLIAGHFGVRSQTTFHPWIASANPNLAAYSPGQAFLGHAIAAMPQLGLKVYDLGPGHDHYKRHYANVRRTVGAGLVTAAGASGLAAGAGEGAYRVSGLGRIGAVDKIRRRLDHIATVDPSLTGLRRGLAEAAAGMRKRGLGNDALSDAVA
jgi:CelD/BcsL family acetyltransferase involved in cellulose biosynthesis